MKLKDIICFLAIFLLSFSAFAEQVKIDQRHFETIIKRVLKDKGWRGDTRNNIEVEIAINDIQLKEDSSKDADSRVFYSINYSLALKAKVGCSLYHFIPKELSLFTHQMMSLECKTHDEIPKRALNRGHTKEWRNENERKKGQSTLMKTGDIASLKNYVALFSITKDLKKFELISSAAWER